MQARSPRAPRQHPSGQDDNRWLWQAAGVDLDLAQVRAFVAVADQEHFGRAAGSLNLTQQALSKRVAKLEDRTGALLERRHGGVSLTPAGARFLPAARHLLDVADHAWDQARAAPPGALRVDVWSELQTPAVLMRNLGRQRPDLPLELSMRRDLGEAVRALERHEVDLAFGNIGALERPLPTGVTSEVVAEDAIAVLVSARNPHARFARVTPEDLVRTGISWPMAGSSRELRAVVGAYAASIGAPLLDLGSNLGLADVVDRVASDPDLVVPVVASWPLAGHEGVRLIPLKPPPAFSWSAVWRIANPHPSLPRVLRALRAVRSAEVGA